MSDENYLNQCLELAKKAVKNGNHPFGALIVFDGEVIVTSENEVVTLNDVTAHAELRLIQKAQKVLSGEELKESILYSSTEPCAMCSGAIYWAGICEVIYGATNEELCSITGGSLEISCKEIFNKGVRNIRLANIKRKKDLEIHYDFWS